MKKFASILVAGAMLLGVLTGCGSKDASDPGSTQPAADAGQSQTQTVSGSVSTNGSTSMEKVIGSLSEQFMTENKDVKVTYDATGSGTGIESVSNGSCDIGLASRALKDTETGLTATTVALDGIAIVVNANCGVDDLTVEQIASIFKGEISSWLSLQASSVLVMDSKPSRVPDPASRPMQAISRSAPPTSFQLVISPLKMEAICSTVRSSTPRPA